MGSCINCLLYADSLMLLELFLLVLSIFKFAEGITVKCNKAINIFNHLKI